MKQRGTAIAYVCGMTNMITQHKNSILNPDVVAEWAAEDSKYPVRIADRALRAAALLPNVQRYFWTEYPRAAKAVELWNAAI